MKKSREIFTEPKFTLSSMTNSFVLGAALMFLLVNIFVWKDTWTNIIAVIVMWANMIPIVKEQRKK